MPPRLAATLGLTIVVLVLEKSVAVMAASRPGATAKVANPAGGHQANPGRAQDVQPDGNPSTGPAIRL
jgi:hypothetical protein